MFYFSVYFVNIKLIELFVIRLSIVGCLSVCVYSFKWLILQCVAHSKFERFQVSKSYNVMIILKKVQFLARFGIDITKTQNWYKNFTSKVKRK